MPKRSSSALITTSRRVKSKYQKSKIPRVLGLSYNGEYKLTRTTNISYGATAGVGFSIGGASVPAFTIVYDPTGLTCFASATNFQVVALPNISEIAALWDRVRIDKVEITFAPTYQQSDGIASASSATPQLLVCNDTNDGATGTTVSSIQQHAGCKHFAGSNSPWTWTVRPMHQRLLYYTPLLSSYEPAYGFVNSDTAIPHYGTKVGLPDVTRVSANMVMTMSFKFFFTCANTK